MEYFSIATTNVSTLENFDHLVTMMLNKHIDIVCVQSYRPELFEKLVRSFKAKGYSGTKFPGITNMIFNIRPPVKKEYVNFISTNQRQGVIIYTYTTTHNLHSREDVDYTSSLTPLPIETVVVSTAQLETLGTGNGHRKNQILELNNIFNTPSYKNSAIIFAGDTSIPSWQTDLGSITPGSFTNTNISTNATLTQWLDAWREKGTTTPAERMDRVWYRGIECSRYDTFDHGTGSERVVGVIATFSGFTL